MITSGYARIETPRPTRPRDPERPTAPLVAVAGREDAAARAERNMRELFDLTGDHELMRAARVSLIRVGIVAVDREAGE